VLQMRDRGTKFVHNPGGQRAGGGYKAETSHAQRGKGGGTSQLWESVRKKGKEEQCTGYTSEKTIIEGLGGPVKGGGGGGGKWDQKHGVRIPSRGIQKEMTRKIRL